LLFGVVVFLYISNNDLEKYDNPYLENPLESNTSMNLISAIYLDYRFYDTIFEVIVFFVAAFCVNMVLEKLPDSKKTKPSQLISIHSEEVDLRMEIAGSFIFTLSVIFSIYIVFSGHIGPGGGFVGGVVAGTGLLVLSGSKDLNRIEENLNSLHIHEIEQSIMFFIPISGIVGLLLSNAGFSNFLPQTTPGTFFSGGNALLFNFLIGFKVFSGTWTILYHFVRHRGVI
jgi:multicomponent Na+:H+ antiporter subunit B